MTGLLKIDVKLVDVQGKVVIVLDNIPLSMLRAREVPYAGKTFAYKGLSGSLEGGGVAPYASFVECAQQDCNTV